MTPDEISNLTDYNYDLDRYKIRYTGIGPKIHEKPGKIWPRDSLNHITESRKILYPDLIKLINNDNNCEKIKQTFEIVFESLRKCNISNLFNKFCPLDHGYFDKIPFAINHSLEAYTDSRRITLLIHKIILSIDSISKRKNFVTKILFGCEKNFNIFKKHIEWLVIGNAKFRKLSIGYFVSFGDLRTDITKITWLNGLCEQAKYRVYIQFIFSLTRFILELLRRYFYITIGNPFMDKLFYYRYDLWQKMKTLTIQKLIKDEYLFPLKFEENLAINEMATSRIKFHLKKDNLRLICTKLKCSDKQTMYRVKAILTEVLTNLKNYEKFSLVNLLLGLKYLKLQQKNEKIYYFVRADIKDCFPSIDQEKARLIIRQNLESMIKNGIVEIYKCNCYKNQITIQGFRKNYYKITRYTLNPDKIINSGKYDTVLIEKVNRISLENFDNDFLRPHLVNCILRESRHSINIYNLTKGLRQGSSLSPIFCSIYIQSAFNKHLNNYYNCNDCKLFNYVDDILFISTNLKKSQNFMIKMLKGFKDYNLRMNLEKLQCNFECPKIDDKYCRRKEKEFVFHKQRITLDNLECRYDFKFNDIELQDTFRVNPYNDKEDIKKTIEHSRISSINLDVELNGINIIIKNIFDISLMLASKVATIILISFKLKDHHKSQDRKYILNIIKLITKRIFSTIELWKKREIIKNDLTHIEIKIIVLEALKILWNSNKLRHRAIERYEIERLSRRSMMKRLTSDCEEICDFEFIIKNLTKEFDKNPFNDLRLPGNSRILTKFNKPKR